MQAIHAGGIVAGDLTAQVLLRLEWHGKEGRVGSLVGEEPCQR